MVVVSVENTRLCNTLYNVLHNQTVYFELVLNLR